MARLENLFGVESGTVEPSPRVHLSKRIYIAQTLVQECQEVPIMVLNATHHDQKLARGPPLSYCEPVGRVFQAHLLNLRKVFLRFREADLMLNAEKSPVLRVYCVT
jgi:hypothetical protein